MIINYNKFLKDNILSENNNQDGLPIFPEHLITQFSYSHTISKITKDGVTKTIGEDYYYIGTDNRVWKVKYVSDRKKSGPGGTPYINVNIISDSKNGIYDEPIEYHKDGITLLGFGVWKTLPNNIDKGNLSKKTNIDKNSHEILGEFMNNFKKKKKK